MNAAGDLVKVNRFGFTVAFDDVHCHGNESKVENGVRTELWKNVVVFATVHVNLCGMNFGGKQGRRWARRVGPG